VIHCPSQSLIQLNVYISKSLLSDTDECIAMNITCGENEKCDNIPGSYMCVCSDGYSMTNGTGNCTST